MALALLAWALAACHPSAGAGFAEGPPREAPGGYDGFSSPERVTVDGYAGDAMEPFLTRDGRYLLFNNSNHPAIDTNLHFAERGDGRAFAYRGEIVGANSAKLDGVASVDRDGRLFFVSTRTYDDSLATIYWGAFEEGAATCVALVPGVSRRVPGIVNFDAEISPDGRTLYFVDARFNRAGIPERADLVFAERTAGGFERRADSAALPTNVNSRFLGYAPAISASGLDLFFTRVEAIRDHAMPAIYRSTRASTDASFDVP